MELHWGIDILGLYHYQAFGIRVYQLPIIARGWGWGNALIGALSLDKWGLTRFNIHCMCKFVEPASRPVHLQRNNSFLSIIYRSCHTRDQIIHSTPPCLYADTASALHLLRPPADGLEKAIGDFCPSHRVYKDIRSILPSTNLFPDYLFRNVKLLYCFYRQWLLAMKSGLQYDHYRYQSLKKRVFNMNYCISLLDCESSGC